MNTEKLKERVTHKLVTGQKMAWGEIPGSDMVWAVTPGVRVMAIQVDEPRVDDKPFLPTTESDYSLSDEGDLIAIIISPVEDDHLRAVEDFYQQNPNEKLQIGISRGTDTNDLENYHKAWYQAIAALKVGQRLNQRGVNLLDDLGSYSLIFDAPNTKTLAEFRDKHLGELLTPVKGAYIKPDEYLDTIQALADYPNMEQAAEAIHVHVNTLKYRVRRLKDFGIVLSDPLTNDSLLKAIMINSVLPTLKSQGF